MPYHSPGARRYYRAPELLLAREQYDCKVDVWAFGCLMAEMARGTPAFQGEDSASQVFIYAPLRPRQASCWHAVHKVPEPSSLRTKQNSSPRPPHPRSVAHPCIDSHARITHNRTLNSRPWRRVPAHADPHTTSASVAPARGRLYAAFHPAAAHGRWLQLVAIMGVRGSLVRGDLLDMAGGEPSRSTCSCAFVVSSSAHLLACRPLTAILRSAL